MFDLAIVRYFYWFMPILCLIDHRNLVEFSWCVIVFAAQRLSELLQLPMHKNEEQQLEQYLQHKAGTTGPELLVLYYLQRSRIVDAIRLNSALKVFIVTF